MNLEVDISLNGNPNKDTNSPKYRNQKEYLTNKDINAPINVSMHPHLIFDSIPNFSLIIFPGMIIAAEKTVKLTINT